MSALGLMGMLPSLVPANTDDVWQGRAKAVDPVAALRQQELDFQHLLQAVKYSAMTNQVCAIVFTFYPIEVTHSGRGASGDRKRPRRFGRIRFRRLDIVGRGR